MTASQCAEACSALGYCCNDHTVGSNQLLSCAQACMIRARGASESQCNGYCEEVETNRGCSRTYDGHTYNFCSRCSDLDATCPHGVQTGTACRDGCALADSRNAEQAIGASIVDEDLPVIFFEETALGIACKDGGTQYNYVMFSQESLSTRFVDHDFSAVNKHFMCVNYDGTSWKYIDGTGTARSFDPVVTTDLLVALMDYTRNVVTMTSGRSGTVGSVVLGYQAGDINMILSQSQESSTSFVTFDVLGGTFVTSDQQMALQLQNLITSAAAASQSSEGWDGTPGRAIDGNPATNYWANSCSHTQSQPVNWWQVDLGEPASVNSVVVHHRTDCCSGRLNNAMVYVSSTPDYTQSDGCGSLNAGNPVDAVQCAGEVGQYITVATSSRYITICELEAYGTVGTRASMRSSHGVCEAENLCANGIVDNSETAVDCGGANCVAEGLTCAIGDTCREDADCSSGQCSMSAQNFDLSVSVPSATSLGVFVQLPSAGSYCFTVTGGRVHTNPGGRLSAWMDRWTGGEGIEVQSGVYYGHPFMSLFAGIGEQCSTPRTECGRYIGHFAKIVVAEATRVQLKVADTVYNDNSGELDVTVSSCGDAGWTMIAQEAAASPGSDTMRKLNYAVPPHRRVRMEFGDQHEFIEFDTPTGKSIFDDNVDKAIPITNVVTSLASGWENFLLEGSSTNDTAYFCKACSESASVRPGDTCWGIVTNTQYQSCGCNSGGWRGKGIYYGGHRAGDCNQCICWGGGFAGKKSNREAKGGIDSMGLKIYVYSGSEGDRAAEVGRVQLRHQPLTVTLRNTYTNPVVFGGIPTYNGPHEAVVRIRSITANSFTMYLDEPRCKDGPHMFETVDWLVIEAGIYDVGGGFQVGLMQSPAHHDNGFDWVKVDFAQPITVDGVDSPEVSVITQIQTHNGPDWVKPRMKEVDTDGFFVRLEEDSFTRGHVQETIGYLAVPAAVPNSRVSGSRANNNVVSYIGCYVDNGNRALSGGGHNVGNSNEPIQACADLCDGFEYFGLQWSQECWCGNEYDRYGAAPESDCNRRCRGNSDVICGGGWRNSVYRMESQPRGYAEYAAYTTADAVTHANYLVNFAEPFREAPAIFGSIITYDGSDPSHLRLQSRNNMQLTGESATMFIQEERCSDSETAHTTEKVSIILMQLGAIGLARPATPETGVCTSCADGVMNGDETAIDCGGSTCSHCSDGQRCAASTDCRSDRCFKEESVSSTFGMCVSCSNHVKDAEETDVDCGGSHCVARCPLYSQCAVDTDCAAGVCRESVCRELTPREKCTNGEQDNFETDVDCGGSLCQSVGIACDDRRSCVVNADCQSGQCYAGVCVSCDNGFVDGDESDIDCGGEQCAQCDTQKVCRGGNDCLSRMCTAEKSTEPPGPQYLGCFVDTSRRAVGNGRISHSHTGNTMEDCAQRCAGHELFSLQYSRECFCGNRGDNNNDYQTYGAAPERECNMACSGDSSTMCGGTWRNSVYSLSDHGELQTATTRRPVVEHCPSGMVLKEGSYPGWYRLNRADSSGGDDVSNLRIRGRGTRRVNVVVPQTIQVETTALTYIGCYVDNGNRALSGGGHNVGNSNEPIQACADLCDGFEYFGLQWSQECWCGNEYDRYGAAPESHCNRRCRGNSDVICGGGWRNSVYGVTTNVETQTANHNSIYLSNDPSAPASGETDNWQPKLSPWPVNVATTGWAGIRFQAADGVEIGAIRRLLDSDAADGPYVNISLIGSEHEALRVPLNIETQIELPRVMRVDALEMTAGCSTSQCEYTVRALELYGVKTSDCVPVTRTTHGICVSCTDGIKNGFETDVDCGGSHCAACAESFSCSENTDCSSGDCTVAGRNAITFDRIVFETKQTPSGMQNVPSDPSEAWTYAESRFNAGAADSRSYCSNVLDMATDMSNRGGCRNVATRPTSRNIAFRYEIPFTVHPGHAGLYKFRWTADWGYGGATRFDNSLAGTPVLTAHSSVWGYTYLEAELGEGTNTLRGYGFEGCCDGVSTLEVLIPDKCDLDPTGLITQLGGFVSLGGGHAIWRGYEPGTAGWVTVRAEATYPCVRQQCGPPTPDVTCANGEIDRLETDVDCGGPSCTNIGVRCEEGQACQNHTDCSAGLICSRTLRCTSCSNGIQDGDETDIDCGGSCNKCAINKKCYSGADCAGDTACYTMEETGMQVNSGSQPRWETIVTNDGSVVQPWSTLCLSMPGLETSTVIQVEEAIDHGDRPTTDYFRPARKMTACEFFTSAENHFWSSTHNGTFLKPAYFTEGGRFGGSARGFPEDGRDFITFWGSDTDAERRVGACCSSRYSSVGWGMPFAVNMQRTGTCRGRNSVSLSSNGGQSCDPISANAKLSDEQINSVAPGNQKVFKLVAPGRQTYYIRTDQDYADTAPSMGLLPITWSVAVDASTARLDLVEFTDASRCSRQRLDSECLYGNTCERLFTDYHSTAGCFPATGQRCFSSGHPCSHEMIEDVEVWVRAANPTNSATGQACAGPGIFELNPPGMEPFQARCDDDLFMKAVQVHHSAYTPTTGALGRAGAITECSETTGTIIDVQDASVVGSALHPAFHVGVADAVGLDGADAATFNCTVTVRLAVTGGAVLDFPQEVAQSCSVDMARITGSIVSVTGPVQCVNEIVSSFRLQSTCRSNWIAGAQLQTFTDDRTISAVTAELISSANCEIASLANQKRVQKMNLAIVGRANLTVTGAIKDAMCAHDNTCFRSGITGASIHATVQSDCSTASTVTAARLVNITDPIFDLARDAANHDCNNITNDGPSATDHVLRCQTSQSLTLNAGQGIELGSKWTIDFWFRRSEQTSNRWQTLAATDGGDHLIAVRAGRLGMVRSAASASVGGSSNAAAGFLDGNVNCADLSTGWHRLTLVSDHVAAVDPVNTLQFSDFEPSNPMHGYIDEGNCGPRGDDAMAGGGFKSVPVTVCPSGRAGSVYGNTESGTIDTCTYLAWWKYECIEASSATHGTSFYLDGQLTKFTPSDGPVQPSILHTIGNCRSGDTANCPSPSSQAWGDVSNFRLYNYALSLNQVTALYQRFVTENATVQQTAASALSEQMGSFTVELPLANFLTGSDDVAHVTISKNGYAPVSLTVPLGAGAVNFGNVYLVGADAQPSTLSGSCTHAVTSRAISGAVLLRTGLWSSAQARLISNINSHSRRGVTADVLARGAVYYQDRRYTITGTLPPELDGAQYIKTANDDRQSAATDMEWLCFDLSVSAVVHVLYDSRVTSVNAPSWLKNGFTKSSTQVAVTDYNMRNFDVWSAASAAGQVCLGGNNARGVGASYVVAVQDESVLSRVSLSSRGGYSFNSVPPGVYTCTCESFGDDVSSSSTPCISNGDNTLPVPAILAPPQLTDSDDSASLITVMSWDAVVSGGTVPRDLDFHVKFSASETGSCHIYYANKRCGNTNLDRDNTRGGQYGGETITFERVYQTVYTVYTHCWSCYAENKTIEGSGMVVKTFTSAGMLTFPLPDPHPANYDHACFNLPSWRTRDRWGHGPYLQPNLESSPPVEGSAPFNYGKGFKGVVNIRLFCIDATTDPPTVHPAFRYQCGEVSPCTTCPCVDEPPPPPPPPTPAPYNGIPILVEGNNAASILRARGQTWFAFSVSPGFQYEVRTHLQPSTGFRDSVMRLFYPGATSYRARRCNRWSYCMENDDYSGLASRILYSATHGTGYARVMVRGYSRRDRGSFTISLSITPST